MTDHDQTQAMLADSIRSLLERQAPADRLREGLAGPDLWGTLVDLGLPAAELPEDVGGLGLRFADLAPLFEEFGRSLATTYYLEFAIIGAWLLQAVDAPAARDLLADAATGAIRPALAFSEFGSAGDPAFTRTRAAQTGPSWRLDGAKSVVVGGQSATHFLVPARIDGPDGDLGLFLVAADGPGVALDGMQLYDGSLAADIVFDGAEIPAGNLLARGAQALDLLDLALDRGRGALCHEAVGLMAAVHELTLDYVKARRQFGQPIGAFQTMQHRLADMFMDLELSRSAADLATSAVTHGTAPRQRRQAVSAAMVTVCRSARDIGQSAVQAHGGIALTREYLAGHYFKRLTMIERYLGTGEDHLERYIALSQS